MKLYSKPGACSLVDHIVLYWSGLPFEVELVDLAQMKSPEFLALNPAGAVPLLCEGDWALTQNPAILHYIADQVPEKALDGGSDLRSLYQRADAHLAGGQQWLAGTAHPTIADAYLYVTLRWAQGIGVDLSGLDALAGLRARMEADAGVQAALKAEGLA